MLRMLLTAGVLTFVITACGPANPPGVPATSTAASSNLLTARPAPSVTQQHEATSRAPPTSVLSAATDSTSPLAQADGTPACANGSSWDAASSGDGISGFYRRQPADLATSEQLTADVRTKDGAVASQIAQTDSGQPLQKFDFLAWTSLL